MCSILNNLTCFTHPHLRLIYLLLKFMDSHAMAEKIYKCMIFDLFSVAADVIHDVICQYNISYSMSSLVTLVRGCCVSWLHVKQIRIGVDKCRWIPVSLYLYPCSILCYMESLKAFVGILDMKEIKISCNGRGIYPFNKGLRIHEGGTTPFWHAKNVYFYLEYGVETLQVVRLAFLV